MRLTSLVVLSCLVALSMAANANRQSLEATIEKFINEFPQEESNAKAADAISTTWAVLAAGSNTFWNYRHQADVAHAYHILIDHGVKPENIIVLMYDDVANDKANPFPGKLFNNPGMKDYYAALKIDYKKNDVTAKNFMAVLKGEKHNTNGGNGKVLQSTENDRVFVYFTDHGSPGMVSFPNDILTVKELSATLKTMHKKKLYDELVFYMEACESGSMFPDLTDDMKVYALTAANGSEPSWGVYCDSIKGLGCLGDEFSVNFLEDSDEEDLESETLDDQYKEVKKRTVKSHVQRFGDVEFDTEPVADFMGNFTQKRAAGKLNTEKKQKWDRGLAIPSRDVELIHMQKKASSNEPGAQEAANRVTAIFKERHDARLTFKHIATKLVELYGTQDDSTVKDLMAGPEGNVNNMNCLHEAVKIYQEACNMNLAQNEALFSYAYALNNMCNHADSIRVGKAIQKGCETLVAILDSKQ